MFIWAFDPGSKGNGVACVATDNLEYVLVDQFPDVQDAWHFYDTHALTTDTVLIEMYRSSGHLTKHAQATIEAVGFLKNAYAYYLGREPVMVAEQARLSGQREAAELMGDNIDTLRRDPFRKDGFSALAHACAYRRRITMENE
jgi:hypothetical protein